MWCGRTSEVEVVKAGSADRQWRIAVGKVLVCFCKMQLSAAVRCLDFKQWRRKKWRQNVTQGQRRNLRDSNSHSHCCLSFCSTSVVDRCAKCFARVKGEADGANSTPH